MSIHHNMKRLFMIVLLAYIPAIHATSLTSAEGILHFIDTRQNVIVINDERYHLTQQTMIYSQWGGGRTVNDLKKGMELRFTVSRESSQSAAYLTEIHILPQNRAISRE